MKKRTQKIKTATKYEFCVIGSYNSTVAKLKNWILEGNIPLSQHSYLLKIDVFCGN